MSQGYLMAIVYKKFYSERIIKKKENLEKFWNFMCDPCIINFYFTGVLEYFMQ